MNDPAFITDIRDGREVRPVIEQRVRAYIAQLDGNTAEAMEARHD